MKLDIDEKKYKVKKRKGFIGDFSYDVKHLNQLEMKLCLGMMMMDFIELGIFAKQII